MEQIITDIQLKSDEKAKEQAELLKEHIQKNLNTQKELSQTIDLLTTQLAEAKSLVSSLQTEVTNIQREKENAEFASKMFETDMAALIKEKEMAQGNTDVEKIIKMNKTIDEIALKTKEKENECELL